MFHFQSGTVRFLDIPEKAVTGKVNFLCFTEVKKMNNDVDG